MHVVEVDSIRFGWCGKFIEEGVEMREMGRDDMFEEVEKILSI